MEDWISIKDLADLTGIPESSARRYARLFSQFLPHQSLGRVVKYHPDCTSVLAEISRLYGTGMDTECIADALASKYPVVLDYDEESEAHELAQNPNKGVLAVALQQMAATMQMVAKQQEDIRELRQDIADLQEAQSVAEQEVRKGLTEAGASWLKQEKLMEEFEERLSRIETRRAKRRWWWPFD